MEPSHRYNPIHENDDLKDEQEDISNETDRLKDGLPTHKARSTLPPWPKILLYMLLAASAGFGIAFGVVAATILLKPSAGTTSSAAATNTLASTLTPAAASATFSSDVPSATGSTVNDGDDKTNQSKFVGQVLDCGWSPEEARAKDCVYDVMMQDWVPKPCYDELLTERYLASGNYTWYSDVEGHTMSDEVMRKGDHRRAWMAAKYHKDHCIFSWEKLIRALRNNQPISQELLSYDHVLHCRHQTLGMGDSHMGGESHKRDGVGVEAPTNYAKCALYNTWRGEFIPDKHSSVEK